MNKINSCGTHSQICEIRNTLLMESKTPSCIMKQLRDPESTCDIKESETLRNFFLATTAGILYSVKHSGVKILTICNGKEIKTQHHLIRGRGVLKPLPNCMVKSEGQIIIPLGNRNTRVNTSDLFPVLNINHQEPIKNMKQIIISKTRTKNNFEVRRIPRGQNVGITYWTYAIIMACIICITLLMIKFGGSVCPLNRHPNERDYTSIPTMRRTVRFNDLETAI